MIHTDLPIYRNGVQLLSLAPQFAAMHARDLHYALATGLAKRHPYDAHLVRLTGRT